MGRSTRAGIVPAPVICTFDDGNGIGVRDKVEGVVDWDGVDGEINRTCHLQICQM